MITVSNLSISFGGQLLFKHVDLQFTASYGSSTEDVKAAIQEVLDTIAHDLKIKPLEDPYSYVKNVQQQFVADLDFDCDMAIQAYEPEPVASADEITALRALIAASSKPCVYIGGGIVAAGAAEELIKFAESYNMPVTSTMMALGAFPLHHPLSLPAFPDFAGWRMRFITLKKPRF